MTTINNNKTWICPYNPAHVLPNNHRTQRHLAKCSKNYTGKDKMACPFNAMHVVSSQEFKDHIMKCPDKCIVERELVKAINPLSNHGDLQEEPQADFYPNEYEHFYQEEEGGEVWEASFPGRAGYNPTDVVKNRGIMRGPKPVCGKATQKKFREKDIRRLEQIERGEAPDTDSEEEEERKVIGMPPLRTKPAPQQTASYDYAGQFNPVYTSKGRHIIGEIKESPLPRLPQGRPMGRAAPKTQQFTPEPSVSQPMQAKGRSFTKPDTTPQNRVNGIPHMVGAGRGKVFASASTSNHVNRPNGAHASDYPSYSGAGHRSNEMATTYAPYASTPEQFQDAPNGSMNDLGGRSGTSVYKMGLEKLKRISALRKKGGTLTREEQELMDSEDSILEALEKLNI